MTVLKKEQRFSIRKSHVGAASVVLGTFLVTTGTVVQAADATPTVETVATTTETELDEAKANVDKANDEVEKQQPVIDSASSDVKKIEQEKAPVKTQLEQEKAALANLANVSTQKVEDDLKAANTKKSDAETALNNAKASDAANQTKIATLDAEVKTANTDVENKQKAADALKEAAENSFVSEAKINLSDDYVNALKKREAVVGGNFRNLQEFRDALAKDPQRKAELDKTNTDLKQFSSVDNAANTYTNSDTTEVNLWNLTDKQKKEINFFAIDLINQVRAEFGKPALVTTQGIYEFAQEIANRSKRIYSKDEKHVAGYEYDLINQVAVEKGLNPDVSGKQRQVDLAQVAEKQEKWLNPKWSDVFAEPGSAEFAEQQPIMTMGALKEQVYGEIKKLLFTPEGGLLRDSERYWELAMNTAGLSGRANMKYGASTVTARIFTYPNDPVVHAKWPKNEIRKLRFYLQNNFAADENAPDTLAGEELNKIIDSTKFDKTAFVNDPEAAKKYEDAKKLLEDAEKLSKTKQTELDKLKAVPSEVAQKQADLDEAIEEVKKAEKALEDAKKSAANTEADKKAKEQKIADLQKRYDELCEKLKEAQEKLTDETSKLNKLKQDAEEANRKYRDLLAKQKQNGPLNGDPLENPKQRDLTDDEIKSLMIPKGNPILPGGKSPSTGKGKGQYIDLPSINIAPEPPVQGPSGGHVPPVKQKGPEKEEPLENLKKSSLTSPGKITDTNQPTTSVKAKTVSTTRVLPKTGSEIVSVLPGVMMVLGAFGLAGKRRKKR